MEIFQIFVTVLLMILLLILVVFWAIVLVLLARLVFSLSKVRSDIRKFIRSL